jgi:hypothetical protein
MGKSARTVTNFRGIMTANSVAQIPPGSAIKCNNVYVDKGGNLQQCQKPTTLIDWRGQAATNLDAVLSLGYIPIANKDPRLLIQQGKKVLYADSPYTAAVLYDGDDLSGILARLDYAVANGITYFSNGQESRYVTPTSTRSFRNGIIPPTASPVQVASTSYGASVTVQRAANIVTVTFASAPNGPTTVGSPVYIDTVSAPWDASFGGVYKITVSGGGGLAVSFPQVGPNSGPFTRATFPGIPVSTLGGYSWGVSYGSSAVAHWSSLSPTSDALVTPANYGGVLMVPASPDPQVDQIALFRTQDGGGTWLLTNAGDDSDGVASVLTTGDYTGAYVILDFTTDEQLTESGQTAPFDNGVAPLGKYLAVWLDRVLMCGIASDPTAVRYTGYDSINFGRPQMSWCAFNNIRLGQGQAYPNGMGLLRYGGMVFFATDGFMYIYRGTLNDITISSPTSLSFYAEQLPYNIGLYSHYSVQSTPAGLVWLDDGLNLRVLENSGFYPPRLFAPQITGILKRMTPGSQDVIQSAYVNYLEKDWYILNIPVDGSTKNNMMIIIDASADPAQNTGSWPTDYAVNGILWLEKADRSKMLIAAMPYLPGQTDEPTAGFLTQIPMTDAILQGIQDQSQVTPPNPPMPGAYWQGGYFGVTDESGSNIYADKKFFRFIRWSSNSQGLGIQATIVDGDTNTFDRPSVLDVAVAGDDPFVGSVNYKGRCLSPTIIFPDNAEVPCTLLTLTVAHVELARS